MYLPEISPFLLAAFDVERERELKSQWRLPVISKELMKRLIVWQLTDRDMIAKIVHDFYFRSTCFTFTVVEIRAFFLAYQLRS